jgi:hypothetical protein
MRYKKYIDLGFKRHDLNDNFVMERKGYSGYYLTYQLNEKTSIEVYWDELDSPRLFTEKNDDSNSFHIIKITTEQVLNILNKNK